MVEERRCGRWDHAEGDLERRRARRERPLRGRGGEPVLPARRGPARVSEAKRDAHDLPLEGGRELLRRGGERRDQPRRRLVLPGAQGGGAEHHRVRRLLARREGRGVTGAAYTPAPGATGGVGTGRRQRLPRCTRRHRPPSLKHAQPQRSHQSTAHAIQSAQPSIATRPGTIAAPWGGTGVSPPPSRNQGRARRGVRRSRPGATAATATTTRSGQKSPAGPSRAPPTKSVQRSTGMAMCVSTFTLGTPSASSDEASAIVMAVFSRQVSATVCVPGASGRVTTRFSLGIGRVVPLIDTDWSSAPSGSVSGCCPPRLLRISRVTVVSRARRPGLVSSTAWSTVSVGPGTPAGRGPRRSEEHTSELQSPCNLVCRLLLEKKKKQTIHTCVQLQC